MSDMALFVAVADQGSISQAARALGLPRSTISRHLKELEERLRVTLIQRTTRKLRLTEAGRIYHQRCKEILAAIARAEAEVSELDVEVGGVLRVGVPSGIGTEWFQEQIGEFFRVYPEIRLELITDHRIRDIHDEDLDLVIVRGPLPDSLLISRRMAPADLLCVASPRYLAAAPPLESPADLRAHRCMIALHEELNGDRWPLLSGESVQITPCFATNDMHYLREALLAGSGVALIPWISVLEEVSAGILTPVLVESVGARGGHYYCVYAPESRHVTKVSATVEFLVDFFARHFGRHTPPWVRG
ncbi:MAG: LysR family transcriptional regulator [Myxococcales bacterium]|nr:LysR family transcriptional regulator [Myxococcales bacterium]MCB9700339.1 LysR family transcriptional regulator [Myxococcales bacterium]